MVKLSIEEASVDFDRNRQIETVAWMLHKGTDE